MKIQRFTNINESLASDVKEFVENFAGSTDGGIVDWVDTVVGNTKLKEYHNFMSSPKKALDFATSKNLKKLTSYLLIDKEIEDKEKELEKLFLKKETLSTASGDELLFKFQEELLDRDFNSFYEFFIKDSIEESDGTIEDIIKYSEIHPRILKKYKDIKDRIQISMAANKYNL